MIEIKPHLHPFSHCPYCQTLLQPQQVLWQGTNICVEHQPCSGCQAEIIESLRVGHEVNKFYQVDLKKGGIFGKEGTAKEWLGKILLESLSQPNLEEIEISKEVFKTCDRIIILNCIDILYGHCLLKLLNAQAHLDKNPDLGLIVIIQDFMRWLVPDGVAEIWTVNVSLKNGKKYYPKFHRFVSQELDRFHTVYLSPAYSHPQNFDLTRFTRIPLHQFNQNSLQITFVWREDRPWCSAVLMRVLKKIKQPQLLLNWQNYKIQKLFTKIRQQLPTASFVVTGLGTKTQFPDWISDCRVAKFDTIAEKQVCQIYADSRLVIGVHGSNMLLPSGQAGMTLDLMPEKRWGNFAQDILYQEFDPRLAAFRYRYLPLLTTIPEIADIAVSMLEKWDYFYENMTLERSHSA